MTYGAIALPLGSTAFNIGEPKRGSKIDAGAFLIFIKQNFAIRQGFPQASNSCFRYIGVHKS